MQNSNNFMAFRKGLLLITIPNSIKIYMRYSMRYNKKKIPITTRMIGIIRNNNTIYLCIQQIHLY